MPSEAAPTWVDRLRMVPLPNKEKNDSVNNGVGSVGRSDVDEALEFNIASLNVLAESYLTPRSHPGLPKRYAEVAFNPEKRRQLLLDTLERFCCRSNGTGAAAGVHDVDQQATKWDILALQELDLLESDHRILPAFKSWGYEVVRTPCDQRRDCSAIAYDANKFSLVNYEVIKFDDLATLQSKQSSNVTSVLSGEGYNNIRPSKKPNSASELTGMVRSFLRRNCAVVAHIKSKDTEESLIVASVHLYWHPGYEYVS